jgi:hypothetical protein
MADPNHVRALVHAGDPTMKHAFAYYSAYQFERSKAAADDMHLDEVVDLAAKGRKVSFLVVLEELVSAVGAGFKEILLVGHGHVEGLLMPVGVPGFGSADKSGLRLTRKLEELLERADKAAALLDPAQRLKSWRELLTDVNGATIVPHWKFGKIRGSLSDLDDAAEGEKLFHQIAPQVAGGSVFKNAEFLRLLQLRKQVTALKLKRLEIRACNMGQDADGMKELKDFLGVGRLLAPVVKTFYSAPISVPINTDKMFKAMVGKFVSKGALKSTSPTRWFTYGPAQALAAVPTAVPLFSLGRFMPGVVIIPMRKIMEETVKGAPDPSIYLRFSGRTIFSFAWGKTRTDNSWVQMFVNNVLDLEHNLNYKSGTFFMAGFDALEGRTKKNPPPPEANNKSIILPNESEYRDLIREVR